MLRRKEEGGKQWESVGRECDTFTKFQLLRVARSQNACVQRR